MPIVVAGVTRGGTGTAAGWMDVCDVIVDENDPAFDRILTTLESRPVASATYALLLRGQERGSIDDGLVAESSAYSVLQSGLEFAGWRSTHTPRAPRPTDDGPRVRVERSGTTLGITLARPEKLNALDARMRDELVHALTVAAVDGDIERVELRGEGRAFCAGGDLDEFGTRGDPASAHLIRLTHSVARALVRTTQPVVAYVHGACVGSGIELPAFADTVIAAPDTQIALPELELGLIPGAGGTVSLPRRIGRLRTARLAYSGTTIDAPTALEWGLVDQIAN